MLVRTALAVLIVGTFLAAPVAALPGPGLNGETTNSIPVVGRVFPEPLMTNDYIGYFEAIAGLEFLNRTYPDRVEFIPIGKSVGLVNRLSGAREPQDVFIVEVTNEKSPVPRENRLPLLFMLSIHGNEKGGREGGFRVVEDFAKGNVGLLAEQPKLLPLLDYFLLVFVFPNIDGWTHDEPQYCCPGGTMYTRTNANGVDLNRQWPTSGFMQADRSHQTLSEPEVQAVTNYLKDQYPGFVYASDIHGMLNPADFRGPPGSPEGAPAWLQDREKGHFILGMLPAGQMTQLEMARQTRLGELIKERLGDHQGFAPWTASPSVGVWGGTFVRWGAVWETIGYQVTGGSHDWFVSDRGLNAPSFSFEMSYNHIVCDGFYPGCGAAMNYFHVNAVRQIVATFMEAAQKDFQFSVDAQGHRTAYVVNPKVYTSEQDRPIDGWAAKHDKDDRWQYDHAPYKASINDFFVDLAPSVRDGDKPAVFDPIQARDLLPETLERYDTLVIAGSAADQVIGNAAAILALKAWLEGGGNLLVTDSALRLAVDLGLVDAGAVGTAQTYMGYTDVVDLRHPLAKDMIGFSRQTFEGVPIGYQLGSTPNWFLRADAVSGKGAAVGYVGGAGLQSNRNQVNYGVLNAGKGTVTFLGALLPDPTTEFYHPYGLASYATTYAGNQFFINMLGMDSKYEAPPRVLENLAQARPLPASSASSSSESGTPKEGAGIPAAGVLVILAGLLCIAVAVRARRRD